VALTGKQKAAMLLMSLDAATATELLKGINPELVQELATELAYLDANGYRSDRQSTQIARQFCNSLHTDHESHCKSFPKETLKSTVDSEKTDHTRNRIQDLQKERDPFIRIRSLDSQKIASVLQKEHPRAAAVVLSELPKKKSSDILNLFAESIRLSAVRRMNAPENITMETKAQIAEAVCKRLDAITADGESQALPAQPERPLSKMALVLRNLVKECRDGLLGLIPGKGDNAGEITADSGIVWEDIPQVADGLLQKALKGIDPKKLALALVKAEYTLVQKITSNISEQAAAALNEQASRVSAPNNKDIEEAREEIVRILRERIM
jgi:flagellar motor switch protein FliG